MPLLVARHAWHTGIVLPASAVPSDSPFRRIAPDADWLELGFGDRLYYPHPDPPFGLALRALFWPSASALNLTAHKGPMALIPADELWLLEASEAGIARAHARALASLEEDPSGPLRPIAPGRSAESLFFAAREPFHILRTCNRWVADVLAAAGIPITPWGVVTAQDLFARLAPFARRLRPRTAVARCRLDRSPRPA